MLAGSVVQFDLLKFSESRIILGEIGTSPGVGFSSRRGLFGLGVGLLVADRFWDFEVAEGDFRLTDFDFLGMAKRLF